MSINMSNIILKLKLLHVTHPLILRIQFVKVRSRMALIGLGRARGQKHGPTLTKSHVGDSDSYEKLSFRFSEIPRAGCSPSHVAPPYW